MKSNRRLGARSRRRMIAVILFVLALFPAALALAAPQYDLKCDDCHTMPPLDSAAGKREPATGAFKGNHQSHADATAESCTKCHGGDVRSYVTSHRDKSVQISTNINASPAMAQYERTFVNQTSVPPNPLGRCSNVNCHFESVTPNWGSDKSATSCDTCHQAQPASGGHSKHVAFLGGGTGTCTGCHPARSGFGHATSAGSRGIQISINPTYSAPGQSYSGSGQNFLPSQSGARALGYCSNVTCHDDGTGNLKQTPVWGTADPDCSVCHPRRPVSGSHTPHLSTSGVGCGSCHNGAVEATTPSSQHVNGKIDVFKTTPGDLGYPAAKDKNTAYTSCSTASCHNDGKGNQQVTPVWGTAVSDRCGACHNRTPGTGSHTAHFEAGFSDCGKCHKGAVDGSLAPERHVNGVVDVYAASPGDLGYPQDKAYNTAGASCTAASCHDDGTGRLVTSPTWGTHVTNCSACHATAPTTGSHTSHLVNAGRTCGDCHSGAVQGTTPPVNHMNGVIKVYQYTPGDLGYPINKAKGSPYTSCSNATCHGTLSKAWGISTNNYQCTKCHGQETLLANYSTATNKQAAPGYGGTGVGTGQQVGNLLGTGRVSDDPKVGAHDTHLRALNNLGRPAQCSDCHTVPATAFFSGHMNGQVDLAWSNLVQNKETIPGSGIPYTFSSGVITPNYDKSTGQCSNVYCHGATLPGGNNKTPSWTDANYLTGDRAHDCSQCHGYPPVTSTKFAHDPSYTDCSQCHPHDGTRTSTNTLGGNDLHMNGKIEAVNFCDTCHDYDTRGSDGSIWGKNQMATEGFGQHAMHINYLKARMGALALDPNADSFGQGTTRKICGTCHTNDPTQHEQNNRQALRKITFGDSSSVRRQFGPNPPHYNGVTNVSSGVTLKTCSNVDCHYKTSPIWSPF